MIQRLRNFSFVILLAPALYAFTYEGVMFLASVVTFEATKWFLLGAALSLLVYVLFLNNRIGFIEHLLHEAEHAALAFLLTFRLPERMVINPAERSEVVVPSRGGCITALAPYYLPLLTIPFFLFNAVVFWLLEPPFLTILDIAFDLLIGATLAFHLVCTVKEYGSFQTDIKTTGYVPSFVGVIFLNFVFVFLSLIVVTGSYSQFLDYAKTAWAATVDSYKWAFEFLMTSVVPTLADLWQAIRELFCATCTPTPTP
jgi:hypothetical protein